MFNRPGLQRALGLLKSGNADGLLIVKLDRLTRSVADWQALIDAYFGERGGKQILSVNDSIDTRTASGRLVLNVLITVARGSEKPSGNAPAMPCGTRSTFASASARFATASISQPMALRSSRTRSNSGLSR